jgi:type IV secretion system protein VirD4
LIYGDVRILELTITTNPFAPAQQLWFYSNSRDLQIVALIAIAPAAALAGAIAVIGLRMPESPLGDASFQTMAMMRHRNWFGGTATSLAGWAEKSSAQMTTCIIW